jgi:6-pyruvoyltetrahydropterin/6-carboxytetrahydropterin synthase
MKIFKDFSFEAAHYLPHVPTTHKCRNLHGHSYKVRVFLNGEPDPILGWVMDFADLKAVVLEVLILLDHHCLNDVNGLENPTAENLAKWLWNKIKPKLPQLYEVQVNETSESGCLYDGTN